MEVVGFAASVIALIQVTGKVSSIAYGYIGKVKRASSDINQLIEELTSLSQVLVRLQDTTNGCAPQSTALQTLDIQLRGCIHELKTLESKLERGMDMGWVRKTFRSLKWPLKDEETSEFMARIERYKSLFMVALGADNFVLLRSVGGQVGAVDHSVRDLTKQFQAASETQNSQKRKEEIACAKQKRIEVLNWLYLGDFDAKHIDISNRRQKDTGKWLLESKEFEDWANGTHNSKLLWGHGIPGAGKTFLSCGVIDHFQDKAQTSNSGVAYFYFDYQEKGQQSPAEVIASLIKQLAYQLPYLPSQIEALYDRLEQKARRPNLEELFVALIAIFKSFNRVFIILDALDECNQETQRKRLLPLFHLMGGSGASLFITSRYYPEDIQVSFHDVPKITISAAEQDIRSYILQRLEEKPGAKRLVQQGGCEERIITELTECARGMFLLVHFHIEHLCQQTTAKQIIKALEKLKDLSTGEHPLDSTYDRVLESIRQQPKTYTELAISILSWLVKAQRALTVQEIQIAVSIDPEQYNLDELDLPDKATILEVCASLITIDEGDTVRLAHLTVQEYLLRSFFIPQEADQKIAIACITYFSFEIFIDACKTRESLGAQLKSYPFLDYAARYMISHLERCDKTISMDLILGFLRRPRNAAAWMLTSIYLRHDTAVSGGYFASFVEDHILLHMASYMGNQLVVNHLLEEGAGVLALDGDGLAAVNLAALSGQDVIIRLLVRHGANMSHEDKFGWTALHCATDGGHEKVVRLLVSEMGADVSVRSKDGYTPLHTAVWNGHETVVRFLLENGADASAVAKNGYTPLHNASRYGEEAVAKLLLENGADASVIGKDGCTPLHWAAQNGHEIVAKILLENGADVSAIDNWRYTPLHWAAEEGHEAVAKILLENGADVSAIDNWKYTPLHRVAEEGHEAVAKILLENSTDVSAIDNWKYTPLHRAAEEGYEAVAKILLENGADVSAIDNWRYTPLHRAAREGHEAVAKILLENGADVSAMENDGYTPLHWAAQNGHEIVAKILLENGADVSAIDNWRYTPLHRAAEEGYEAVAKILLENGADVSAIDNWKYTPLHRVAEEGHEAVAKILLENGADVSATNESGYTPLQIAINYREEVLVNLLSEYSINVNAEFKGDGTKPGIQGCFAVYRGV